MAIGPTDHINPYTVMLEDLQNFADEEKFKMEFVSLEYPAGSPRFGDWFAKLYSDNLSIVIGTSHNVTRQGPGKPVAYTMVQVYFKNKELADLPYDEDLDFSAPFRRAPYQTLEQLKTAILELENAFKKLEPKLKQKVVENKNNPEPKPEPRYKPRHEGLFQKKQMFEQDTKNRLEQQQKPATSDSNNNESKTPSETKSVPQPETKDVPLSVQAQAVTTETERKPIVTGFHQSIQGTKKEEAIKKIKAEPNYKEIDPQHVKTEVEKMKESNPDYFITSWPKDDTFMIHYKNASGEYDARMIQVTENGQILARDPNKPEPTMQRRIPVLSQETDILTFPSIDECVNRFKQIAKPESKTDSQYKPV